MTERVQSAGARQATAVTKSDVTVVNFEALYIGVTGDVAVITKGGTTITFKNVPVGILPISCTKVLSTGTGASEIIGLEY
jgi:hypothetical protein